MTDPVRALQLRLLLRLPWRPVLPQAQRVRLSQVPQQHLRLVLPAHLRRYLQ